MRLKRLALLALSSVLMASCTTRELEAKKTLSALSLALEQNLDIRELNISCGTLAHKKLVSKFILIPINKEVIDAAVNHKSVVESLSQEEKDLLLTKSYKQLLNSNKITFVSIIANNPKLEYGKDSVYFEDIQKGLTLSLKGKKYKLVEFTANLATELNPGWNTGYLHFENFQKDYSGVINAYSVIFDNFQMVCNNEVVASQQFSLSFDDSEIDFLALIDQGLTAKEIKSRYIVNTFETIKLTKQDVDNIIAFTMKLI